jgi:hypothetical protein
LLERVIVSSMRLFPQLHKWHIMIVRAGEQKQRSDATEYVMRMYSGSLHGSERLDQKKFGAAAVKRGMAKPTSCRPH